ncbi:transcription factor HES-2 [Tiliqua scincoides]|uniref:transcription factor HES-2 n=1 Tax=Tiliqua scincoides TaxID=71010 RepID=UPI003462C78F
MWGGKADGLGLGAGRGVPLRRGGTSQRLGGGRTGRAGLQHKSGPAGGERGVRLSPTPLSLAPAMAPLSSPAPSSFSPRMGAAKKAGAAPELRKNLKPLMEKRRRARINDSLNQLKTLILPLIGKDVSSAPFRNSRYSKLEKADILEMTVQFLKEFPSPRASVSDSSNSYYEGYQACLSQLTALLPKYEPLNWDSCCSLLGRLQQDCEERGSLQDCSGPTDLSQAQSLAMPLCPARRAQEDLSALLPMARPVFWRPW